MYCHAILKATGKELDQRSLTPNITITFAATNSDIQQ